MATILNLKVSSLSLDHSRGAVMWDDGTDRFHVWVSIPGLIIESRLGGRGNVPTLYKNSISDRGEPGHHEVRHLNALALAHAPTVSAALARVRQERLIEVAIVAANAKDRQAAEDARAAATAAKVEEHAAEFLWVAQEVLRLHAYPDEDEYNQMVDRARAVIAKVQS